MTEKKKKNKVNLVVFLNRSLDEYNKEHGTDLDMKQFLRELNYTEEEATGIMNILMKYKTWYKLNKLKKKK